MIKILNRVLIKLGENPIADWQQTPYGPKLQAIYNDMLPALISAYPWRFALKRAVIAKSSEVPAGVQFKYSFPLPSDCLQLYQVYASYKTPNNSNYIYMSDERYTEENGAILCNSEGNLFIRYVYNNTETSKFPLTFREALICKIAAEFSTTPKNSANTKQIFEQEFAYWINQAMANNNIADDSESMPDGSWVSVRENWRI